MLISHRRVTGLFASLLLFGVMMSPSMSYSQVTTGSDQTLQCSANGSKVAQVAVGGQVNYSFVLPTGATNTSYTFMVDKQWGPFSPGVEYAWTPTNGTLAANQAGFRFTLKTKTFVNSVYQDCAVVVQGLLSGEAGITPSSTAATFYTEDGRCPRTVRTSTTSNGATQMDHFYQCGTTSETNIANFLESVMQEGLRNMGLPRQTTLPGLKTWLLSNGGDVSTSTGGNNLAANLRAVNGFSSFATARAAASSNALVFLNCSGTVSTNAGSCAIVVQHSDPVTLKSVTIQTGSLTIASAGMAAMNMVRNEVSTLEHLAKAGAFHLNSDQLTIPEPPMPYYGF